MSEKLATLKKEEIYQSLPLMMEKQMFFHQKCLKILTNAWMRSQLKTAV